MIARALVALIALALAACATVPSAPASPARLVEWTDLDAGDPLPPMRVAVWLPPGYDGAAGRPYPVLYMWDGQNLFDPATTHYGKAWMMQEVMANVVATGRGEPHIVVGIWSPPGADRYRVYLPPPLYHGLATTPDLQAGIRRMAGGAPAGDAMLTWVADTLKPRVDAAFRTRGGARDTTIAGASMGGLMACYALIERPEIFGRAGCLSSHLMLVNPELAKAHRGAIEGAWRDYLAARLGTPAGRRAWLDHGTLGLDANYAPFQDAVARDFAANGWREGDDMAARVFTGTDHDENAWGARMADVLAWLWR